MQVGESKYPHPLITLVAVLVTALALSAIIWAETGWPWQCYSYDMEGTEKAETSSYIEFNGVGVTLANSVYGGEAAENPFTFALTPRFLVFPDGERYRYEVKPGKVIAWDGLPEEALSALSPERSRASIYIGEFTPIVLLNHLLPQFFAAGFFGVDFILKGPEGESFWMVNWVADKYMEGFYPDFICLYWDRRVLQWGTRDGIIRETSTDEYLFLSGNEFEMVVGNEGGPVILLPGANTTFGELVAARDIVWRSGEPNPYLAAGFDDPAVDPFKGILDFNPGLWIYDIQPGDNNPAEYYIE